MKHLYLFSVLFFTCLLSSGQQKNATIQVVMSNNEFLVSEGNIGKSVNNVLWTNDFSNPSDWTSSNALANAQDWIITTNGPAGIYSNTMGTIASSTASNGFALYDSDYIGTSGGSQDATISLVSSINFSNTTDLELSFEQKFRRYQTEHCYVGISTDGSNWNDIEINASVPSAALVSNTVTVDISGYADNQSQVWVRFRYVGSWDYAWMVDDVVIEGNPVNTPEIVLVTPNQAESGESLSVSLSGQYTHFSQGSQTIWFEQGSQTIMSGTNIFVQSQSQMNFDLSVPLNAPLGMYDVKVENPTDGVISKYNGFEVLAPVLSPGWSYSSIGSAHTILIPNFANINVDGSPVVAGDYIGVFYDNNGTLACGGYIIYTGTTSYLYAHGDDPGTSNVDGFTTGEIFQFKIWQASSGLEYDATATFEPNNFPNTSFYASNGLSGISAINGFSQQTQTLVLQQGWRIFSTYITPDTPDVETVFYPVVNELLIIKNGVGQVYWPPFVNMIGDLVLGQGYQINMASSQTLDIVGAAAVPELTPITIPNGWSIFGYLRTSSADITTMLSSVVSNITIVKNDLGAVYWPYWGVNGIGTLDPGKGYQIKTTQTVTLTYPANAVSAKSLGHRSVYQPSYYHSIEPTGSNMTLGVTSNAWDTPLAFGDEVAIFSKEGNLVGSTVYQHGNIAIAIWGDDLQSLSKVEGLIDGERYNIRVFRQAMQVEQAYYVNNWIEGNDQYKKDGISVAGNLSLLPQTELLQAMPNPCNNATVLSITSAQQQSISLSIFSSLGQVIEQTTLEVAQGSNRIELETSTYPAGNYLISIEIDNKKFAKQLQVVR